MRHVFLLELLTMKHRIRTETVLSFVISRRRRRRRRQMNSGCESP